MGSWKFIAVNVTCVLSFWWILISNPSPLSYYPLFVNFNIKEDYQIHGNLDIVYNRNDFKDPDAIKLNHLTQTTES